MTDTAGTGVGVQDVEVRAKKTRHRTEAQRAVFFTCARLELWLRADDTSNRGTHEDEEKLEQIFEHFGSVARVDLGDHRQQGQYDIDESGHFISKGKFCCFYESASHNSYHNTTWALVTMSGKEDAQARGVISDGMLRSEKMPNGHARTSG